jgi:penicillin-binding protein 2
VVRAIYKPGVPNGTPGYVDLSKAKLVQSFLKGGVSSQVPIDGDALQAIVSGLRQNITGPGVTLPDGGVRSTTAEELFEIGYPEQAIPIAGKTGTAQGSKSLPWNDSSAFAAFSLDDTRPYTVVAYLEKAGFGSQGAAPVVKCMYLALSGLIQTRPVELADPLDLDSTEAAADVPAAATKCLESSNFDPNPTD